MIVEADSLEQRILDAARACIARFGVAKTTVDDIAREAGCSRATVYRVHSGRAGIFAALAAREADAVAEIARGAAAGRNSLDDALVAVIVEVARALVGNPALQFVLVHEPEAVTPFLVFDGADVLLGAAAELGREVLAPWLAADAPHDLAGRGGELVARLLMAYVDPTEISHLTDTGYVRALVHDFVVPGLGRATTSKGSSTA